MNSHTPTRVRLAATFFALATATVSFAQIPAEHAVVLTEQTVSPRSLLLDVDLKTGKFTPMGRFGLDGLPPLAVRHDPVNRDLIVAIRWPTGSRILRLKYSGTKLASQRVIADVSGQVTDMVLALSDQIFFTTGGNTGGLWRMPRNGGKAVQVAQMPRLQGLATHFHTALSGYAVQSGLQAKPVVDPSLVQVSFQTGKINATPLKGYRPLDITGVAILPNAVQNKLLTHADGTIGEVVLGKSRILSLTPKLPAGGARRLRMRDNLVPYVLGGKAHPRLATFAAFGNGGGKRTVTMVTGNMPGDPVDFDITPRGGPKLVPFGSTCGSMFMRFGGTRGGIPQVGNQAFNLGLSGHKSSSAILALGISDASFGGAPLPWALGGGCQLLVSVDTLFAATLDARGLGSVLLPIPNIPSLDGRIVFAQFAQAPQGQLETSPALAVQVSK